MPSEIVDCSSLSTLSSSSTPQSSPISSHTTARPGTRRLRHDTFPSVQLDKSVKQKLLSRNWHIPLYESSRVNVATLAQDGDFHYVQRVIDADDETAAKELGYIRVIQADSNRFKRAIATYVPPRHTGTKKLLKDRGSSTDDLLATTLADGIQFLQGCFPEVSEMDLADLLEHCDENLEWAMELLLESMFEGELVMLPKPYASSADIDLYGVPSLISLSHGVLCGVYNGMDQSIVERLTDVSISRIKFIQEFHTRTLRTNFESSSVVLSSSKSDVKHDIVNDMDINVLCAEDIVIKLDSHVAQQLSQLYGQPANAKGRLGWCGTCLLISKIYLIT